MQRAAAGLATECARILKQRNTKRRKRVDPAPASTAPP